MVTRFRIRSNRPTKCLNLHVSSVSPLPKSYHDAFNDLNWQNAINDEYNALIKNNTWTLVPCPMDEIVVRCTWLFCHKYLADGTLCCYKVRLVANGSTQLKGIDVDETCFPVVKPVYMHQPPGFQDSVHPDYQTLSRSDVEAKYRGVANAVAESCWLRNILRDLHTPLSSAMLIYCDNFCCLFVLQSGSVSAYEAY
ncbi:ribonuclease H-like domain-containing protein [Tanacetum coccineum]